MISNPEYSIVIPVYNGQDSIEELYDRIKKVFKNITPNYEVILVDDNSKDESWKILKKIYQNNKDIKIIHLMKNYGQHSATLCGFRQSKGNYVITLDDDLQNPPEEIPKIIEASRRGYQVVFGRYSTKKMDLITNMLSRVLQLLIQRICGLPKTIVTSSFSVYHRDVVDNITGIKSAFPFLPALIVGSVSPNKIINVDVLHNERKIGRSNYNFLTHFRFSLNLIINYSSLPLVILSIIGFILSSGSFIVGLNIIINRIIDPFYGLTGWNSMMVTICFIGGAILMGMGIIGEYLRRILTEVSYGQQYVIEEMES